jgi:hypothetical protein
VGAGFSRPELDDPNDRVGEDMKRTCLVLVALVVCSGAASARAEVVRVDVSKRSDVGSSGYEKIAGTIYFALDPRDARNSVIVDLDKAVKNAQGRVEFSADLYILRPKDAARSNGVAFVEVSNRGRKGLLSGFSRAAGGGLDPATDTDLGDGFLTRAGYTLVWVGWQFDVARQENMMKLNPPIATGISGIVRADFTLNARATEQTLTDLAGYSPADPMAADTTLTVRDGAYGKAQAIPRGQWQLNGNRVTMPSGFEPGRTYELAYRATNLPVVGTGLAAFRDTASWLKHSPDALAPAKFAYAWGSSQSGRFLRTFLYYGFNSDEKGRQVFDGVMAHIAGAARLSINERGAVPNSLTASTATRFPFADAAQRDPIGGTTEGLLDNARARQNQPKIFYTNSAVEYWNPRAAALIHTTADGRSDLTLPANVRTYFLTGTQHSPGQFPPRATTGQQAENPVQYWWTLRALLVSMDRWVREGAAPPASQHPKLSDGTLVRASEISFPAIPGVQSPRILTGAQQDSKPLPFLVPQVDADGNERAGIRAPEQAVAIATYTGWNFRSPSIGAPSEVVSLAGSSVAFAKTAADRLPNDPRRSISERYSTKDQYLKLSRDQFTKLVRDGYLLAEDEQAIMKRADDQWELSQRSSAERVSSR